MGGCTAADVISVLEPILGQREMLSAREPKADEELTLAVEPETDVRAHIMSLLGPAPVGVDQRPAAPLRVPFDAGSLVGLAGGLRAIVRSVRVAVPCRRRSDRICANCCS